MKKSYYLSLLLLFPCSLLAQELKIFNDTSFSFTAKYPVSWTNKIKEGKKVFFTSPADGENDHFYENINVSVTKNAAFGNDINVKDAIPSVLKGLNNTIDKFSLESEIYFKWNNNEACELIYTGQPKNSDLQIKITQWFCFSNERLFTATYTALASNIIYTAPALKILQSISFR